MDSCIPLPHDAKALNPPLSSQLGYPVLSFDAEDSVVLMKQVEGYGVFGEGNELP